MKTLSIQEAVEQAVKLHQAGQLGEAEAIYRQVLTREPRHAQALHMLGIVAHQVGRDEVALELITQSLAVNPRSADALSNRGLVLMRLGRLDEAIADLQQSVALNPNYPEAHNNLGNALFRTGRTAEAIAHCQQAVALRPIYPEAWNNLGNALLSSGRTDEAIATYQRVITQKPDYHEALNNLGIAYLRGNRFDEALAILTKSLELRPNDPDVMNNLGNVYEKLRQPDQAIATFKKAVALNPRHPDLQHNLGNAHLHRGESEAAMACFRQAILFRPNYAEAHQSIGNLLYSKGLLDEAIAEFRLAIQYQPDYYEAYSNLGIALHSTGDLANAEIACRKSLSLRPNFPAAHWNLGLTLLLQGRLQEGWNEYNWRWQVKELDAPKRDYPVPAWDGRDLGGQRILLHAEQGFGDTLQFVRYVPLVVQRGGRVILGCQKELVPLFTGQFQVERYVIDKEILPPFGVHAALLNLPLILGTTLETIPAAVPYIAAHPAAVQRWRDRIDSARGSASGGELKVGIAWAGRAAHANDRNRSIALSMLAPLARIKGVRFFSLQKDRPAKLSQGWPQEIELTDWTSDLNDFSDTAGLLANLDQVITVDTALAHLAGAMAKPTWVLLPFMPDWRWMLKREDSPWYPTMRLFRQPKHGDWQSPLRQLTEALEAAVAAPQERMTPRS